MRCRLENLVSIKTEIFQKLLSIAHENIYFSNMLSDTVIENFISNINDRFCVQINTSLRFATVMLNRRYSDLERKIIIPYYGLAKFESNITIFFGFEETTFKLSVCGDVYVTIQQPTEKFSHEKFFMKNFEILYAYWLEEMKKQHFVSKKHFSCLSNRSTKIKKRVTVFCHKCKTKKELELASKLHQQLHAKITRWTCTMMGFDFCNS